MNLVVFCARTSRVANLKLIHNQQSKSLFCNILPISLSTSRFCRGQGISQGSNSKKTRILPSRYQKTLAGISRIVFLLVAFTAIFSAPAPAEILKLVINDTIQPISAEYIARAIDEAQRRNDQAILIEMNTPGGLVDSTRDIIQHITASPVPVIIYVAPGGSRAASAGFFILESADIAAMAPGTNTGAAHPVLMGGEKMDDVMKEKMENDAAALMRSVAARRGRNVEVAESTVRQSKSFSDQEALSQHLIE